MLVSTIVHVKVVNCSSAYNNQYNIEFNVLHWNSNTKMFSILRVYEKVVSYTRYIQKWSNVKGTKTSSTATKQTIVI